MTWPESREYETLSREKTNHIFSVVDEEQKMPQHIVPRRSMKNLVKF